MLIEELYKKDMITFAENCDGWEAAIYASIEPLVREKIVTPLYGQKIIESVNKYGSYINISEDVCIPHASACDAVQSSGIAMMVTQEPVKFDDDMEFSPRIFFAFCATDPDDHLDNLAEISALCSDESQVKKILRWKTKEDVKKYLSENGPVSIP